MDASNSGLNIVSGINSQCEDAETVYYGAFKPLNVGTVQLWRAVLKRNRIRASASKGIRPADVAMRKHN